MKAKSEGWSDGAGEALLLQNKTLITYLTVTAYKHFMSHCLKNITLLVRQWLTEECCLLLEGIPGQSLGAQLTISFLWSSLARCNGEPISGSLPSLSSAFYCSKVTLSTYSLAEAPTDDCSTYQLRGVALIAVCPAQLITIRQGKFKLLPFLFVVMQQVHDSFFFQFDVGLCFFF